MIGLVLDTNVLVSANLSAEGLEALVVSLVLNRKVRLYVSAAILEEYERVLLYPRFRFEPQEVSRFLAALRRASVTVKPTPTTVFWNAPRRLRPIFWSPAISGTSPRAGRAPAWSIPANFSA